MFRNVRRVRKKSLKCVTSRQYTEITVYFFYTLFQPVAALLGLPLNQVVNKLLIIDDVVLC